MSAEPEWTKEAYKASVTSRCWAATPYDAGWDGSEAHGEDLRSSAELRSIFCEEMALGAVPAWAVEIVDRMIAGIPTCGHYTFPRPLVQICQAIRDEKCPDLVFGCYTADPGRKTLMSYYVYCLDTWRKSAPLDVAAAELAMRDDLGKDWPRIVAAVYDALGARSEAKEVAVSRLIHRLRWWIKTLIWTDDRRERFMLDVYAGDVGGDAARFGCYGNPPYGDPYFVEKALPEMQELDAWIRQHVPGGEKLLELIESTWLCAPKAFRYVERIIQAIGDLGSMQATGGDASILQCEDTYPDFASCQRWYASFKAGLTGWLEGDRDAMKDLGDVTPAKHWLVRMLRHKLELHEKYNQIGNMIVARRPGRSGSRPVG